MHIRRLRFTLIWTIVRQTPYKKWTMFVRRRGSRIFWNGNRRTNSTRWLRSASAQASRWHSYLNLNELSLRSIVSLVCCLLRGQHCHCLRANDLYKSALEKYRLSVAFNGVDFGCCLYRGQLLCCLYRGQHLLSSCYSFAQREESSRTKLFWWHNLLNAFATKSSRGIFVFVVPPIHHSTL